MYLRFSTHYYVLILVSAEHGCIVGIYSSVIKHENSAVHLISAHISVSTSSIF